jgi:tRNA dimethylallyltransferase
MVQPNVICIMGPTASGKTDLAIQLAEQIDAELISVDSALVYRDLDIGSAKPEYPHHLVDIRDPADIYTVADFVRDADSAIVDIVSRGKTPILVGGTMMYFKAFLEGLSPMPASDECIRAEIEAKAARLGWPALHKELTECDPIAAAVIHPNHSSRITRALEVFRYSGIPLSVWQERSKERVSPLRRFRVNQFALTPVDRAVLHERIRVRFEQMMAQGFLGEVCSLHAREDLHADLPAIRAVGYRQLWEYLDHGGDLDEAIQKGIAATRQLAKRQLTWLRKWPELTWLYTDAAGNFLGHAESERVGGAKKMLDALLNCIEAPQ